MIKIIIIVAVILVLVALGYIFIRYIRPKFSNQSVIRLSPSTSNKVEILFSDIGDPFLLARVYEKGNIVRVKALSIRKEQIEDGKIVNVENIIDQLKELKIEKYSIDLVLCSQMIFDSVISLPKINAQKAEQLKKKEMKDSFDKYKDFYRLIEKKYAYNLGVVYTEYFVPTTIIDNWRQIAKGVNAKLSTVRLFGDFLYQLFKKIEKTDYSLIFSSGSKVDFEVSENKDSSKKNAKIFDYALIFVHGQMATFVLSMHDQLISSYSFEFTTKEEIIKRFILVIGKYEMELVKKPIKDIYIDSDVELDFENSLPNQNIHYIHLENAEKDHANLFVPNVDKEETTDEKVEEPQE